VGHTGRKKEMKLAWTQPVFENTVRILRFFKFKNVTFCGFFCFVAYVYSNNDRQCLLPIEVYQIARLRCAL